MFAPIEGESHFINEKEVLFSLNAVFQIESIDSDEQYQVWKVRMIVTDEGSKYVDEFLKAAVTTEQKISYTSLMFYSHVLWYEFYQLDKAKEYFQNLIKTLSRDHPDFPIIYYQLGCICHKKEQCSEALANLQHARDLLCMLEQEKSEQMSLVWHVMGKVYCDTGDLDESLDCSQRALSIWDPNVEHIEKAHTIEYIAKAYERKNITDYCDKILDYYTQALTMY
jgi:tetratricopeptide (TPR) repeat protein